MIIGEYQHLAGVSRPSQSVNKISAAKHKSGHLPSWTGKSREEQPNASGSSDQKKKGHSHAGKQVKEQGEVAKQSNHAHMAESMMVVDPSAPTASSSASLPAPPAPLLVIMMINGNSRIMPASAFILKALLAAIAAKPIPHRYTGSTETRPGVWSNAKKVCDLADHMDITATQSDVTSLFWLI